MRIASETLTIANASAVKGEGLKALEKSDAEFDFSSVRQVDSSAIAVLMSWIRQAEKRKLQVRVIGAPQALNSLIRLYGLESLLGTCFPLATER